VDHNDYAYGGLPKEHSYATRDAWQQMLQFFKEQLK
jgi:dienelactone hydrolase